MESPPKAFNGDSAIVLDPCMVSDEGGYKMLILYAKISVAEKKDYCEKRKSILYILKHLLQAGTFPRKTMNYPKYAHLWGVFQTWKDLHMLRAMNSVWKAEAKPG